MLIKLTMQISFIEVKSPGAHIYSKFPIPRLGSVLLSTILKNNGYNVKVFIEDIDEPDWLYVENSDIVCISTITSTVIRAYELADKLRLKDKIVILGGPHPSFLPEESLKHSDYVVRGEGDYTLPELIGYLTKGSPSIESILGLSYIRDNKIINNPPRPLLDNLDILPEPDFSLVHGWKIKNIYPISTSRGCPFDCKFCSVIQMFGRKYRFKSVQATLKEIRSVATKVKSTIFFVDDNFTANKNRTKEILKAMISEKIKIPWSAQVRTDVAKDSELLRLMADANCTTLYIGFESINPETLKLYSKKQSLEEIVNCIKAVKDKGISIHGMFVVGADTDSLETIHKTTDFAINLGIDTIQFMILTPLPGTPIFDEMKKTNRLLHTDWSKYDAHHVVYKPILMSPEQLQIETLKAMGRFYSWRYILNNLLKFKLYYAGIGLYGKNAIKRSLKDIKQYLSYLEDGYQVA
jgi:radical SAM superfamily enzyme YgiQ (UPF0313 family)